ncbi:isochorismatase family protein [Chloroflexota bacterium]
MPTNKEQILTQYKKAGIGKRMGFGERPCILVIDFQKGLTDPQYPLAGKLDKEMLATCELLDVARQKKVPIIFTVTAYDGSGHDGGRYFDKIPSLKTLLKGTPMTEVNELLGRRPTENVIEKNYQSAFFGTSLFSLLNSLHIDTVIACGCVTSSCVRSTAIDSMQLGFYTIIPKQCVGDRVDERHESNLLDLDTKSADVLDKEDVLGYLNKLPIRR